MAEQPRLSLNDVREQLQQQDWLLTCTVTVPVRIMFEHVNAHEDLHVGVEDGAVQLDPDYYVELYFPPEEQEDRPFINNPCFREGDAEMFATLEYPSDSGSPIKWEHIIRALQLDPAAKIWEVSEGTQTRMVRAAQGPE